MTVEQLIERLLVNYEHHKNDEIVVRVEEPGTMGGTPCIGIKDTLYFGFDWDHGRVFLLPKEELKTVKDPVYYDYKKCGNNEKDT